MIPSALTMPSAAVYRFTSSMPAAMVTTLSMIVLPPPGIPSRAGIWPMVMTTASPITKPVTTDAARNCDRKPSRATPATIRMPPTMSASAALSAMNRLASPAATAPTTDADMIATDELAVTFISRDVPNTAYAVNAAKAVTRPVSGGIPARPA